VGLAPLPAPTKFMKPLTHSTSLWMLTTAQLRDKVASIEATPGGGSVSIVAATLAIASVQKGVVVSLKRAGTGSARHESLLELSSRASALMVSLSKLADADSLAFQSYLEACALPRTSEHEKAARKMAKEAGMARATQVPLEAAAEMRRALELAEAAAKFVDAQVRSEVLAGGVLLRASIHSVLLSVDANLGGISDAALRDSFRLRRNEMEQAAGS
jgi:formiminotetrahydrofolate cyclodeaminase